MRWTDEVYETIRVRKNVDVRQGPADLRRSHFKCHVSESSLVNSEWHLARSAGRSLSQMDE